MHPVWKRPAGIVGGETLSLDDIENVKLRTPEVRDTVTHQGRPSGFQDRRK